MDQAEQITILQNGMEDIRQTMKTFATKNDLKKVSDSMATKEDVKAVADSVAEMVMLFKNFKIGIHVGGKIFGVSGKLIMWLSGIVIALGIISGGFKGVLVYLGLGWLFGIKP